MVIWCHHLPLEFHYKLVVVLFNGFLGFFLYCFFGFWVLKKNHLYIFLCILIIQQSRFFEHGDFRQQ